MSAKHFVKQFRGYRALALQFRYFSPTRCTAPTIVQGYKPQYNLWVESNQNIESKQKRAESQMENEESDFWRTYSFDNDNEIEFISSCNSKLLGWTRVDKMQLEI